MPETARVRVLDATSYGERFLARGSRARASCDVAHCVSVMHVAAEKFRQDVDGFSMFEGAENEGSFRNVFERALDEYERMTTTEKTACVMFAIRAFASLEKETVRKVMLPLVSLPLWTKLSDGRLRLELTKHEALAKHHAKLLKKEAKAAKKAADEGATHV